MLHRIENGTIMDLSMCWNHKTNNEPLLMRFCPKGGWFQHLNAAVRAFAFLGLCWTTLHNPTSRKRVKRVDGFWRDRIARQVWDKPLKRILRHGGYIYHARCSDAVAPESRNEKQSL